MLDTKNGSIDLDELLNSLLKEKQDRADKEITEAVSAPAAAPVLSVGEPLSIISEEEDEDEPLDETDCVAVSDHLIVFPDDEPKEKESRVADVESQSVIEPAAEPLNADEDDSQDETEANVEKSHKGLFGWLRRRENERPMEEEWIDWGLKPIGHYREGIVSDSVDISSGRQNAMPPSSPLAEPELTTDPMAEVYTESTVEPTVAEEQPVASVAVETAAEPVAELTEEPVATSMDKTMVVDAAGISAAKAAPVVTEPKTMVMPVVSDGVSVKPIVPVVSSVESSEDEQVQSYLPNQVSLEELMRIEDIEDESTEAPLEEEEDPEVRLQRAREEKVKEFVLGGDEEEENEPEEEAIPEEEEAVLEDFTGYDTADAVRLDMQYQRRAGTIGLVLTIGLEILLTVFTLVMYDRSFGASVGYLTVHMFALIMMMALNYSSVLRGLSGLFTLDANNDSAPALAMVVSFGGVIAHFINMEAGLPAFAPLAGLLMTFNAIGRQIKLRRIWDNFAFVSYQGDKYAAALIQDGKTVAELSRHAMADGMTNVAYFRRTSFLSSYLGNAMDEDDGDRYAKYGMPIALGISLVLSLVLLLVGSFTDFWTWASGFIFMLCVSAFTLTAAMQLPMRQVCRRMMSKGGFLVGWNAVESFGRPDALVVDVADLYSDETMLLHGIKTFSGMHIDAAILDAASLSIRAGGPLSLVFRRIIENREDILREVDSLTYEQGMGLSGWVDGRRVLVGNRRLLQNHDVDVPSMDYEARYAKNGRRLVYLSTSGELSAMFVVSYLPDETVAHALRGLCRSRVTLLVRSNDANVTAESLCTDFELDEYYVDVLPATVGRLYDKLLADDEVDTPAMMASNGHILGTSLVMAACRSLRIKSYLAVATQSVMALGGLGLCAAVASMSIDSFWFLACGYMLGAGLLSWLVPLFKR